MRSFFKHFVVFITFIAVFSCKETPVNLSEIKASRIDVTDSIIGLDTINAIVAPYRDRINQVLDSTLAYAANDLTKTDGEYNHSIGNLLADIVYTQANPIFNQRTGNSIDFVVLNDGGIRSIISKGDVSSRTAYEVMPFENYILVLELDGKSVRELVNFLTKGRRPHPVSGIKIVKNKEGGLESLTIQGKPFNERKKYFVATSDYLYQGGDDMGFFNKAINVNETDYLIRNAMIDYFKKVDTLRAIVDDRFIKIK